MAAEPWKRHIIDDASKGADGTRLADANGDGLPDIVTGWEQGGVVRLALHPGKDKVGNLERWPSVEVARVKDVEDAVLVDLDGDGALDVVSSCEGKTATMYVSWSPADKNRILDPAAWQTAKIPVSQKAMMWMFALPMQIDGKHGVDLIAGAKGSGAHVGWFEAPANPRDLAAWKWHSLRSAGWIMSLVSSDMDGDGDADLVFSDRKGNQTGVFWLKNPGKDKALTTPWSEHAIGGTGREVMFLELADLDKDGLEDVVVATKPAEVLYLRRKDKMGDSWESLTIPYPANSGFAKAVNVGDIDLDGSPDLVVTCERAKAPLKGISWLSCEGSPLAGKWQSHDISGADGEKHDMAPLVDLDGDGDLDMITTEEVKGLGVIWYENPSR